MGPSLVPSKSLFLEAVRFAIVGLFATALYALFAVLLTQLTDASVLVVSSSAYMMAAFISFFAHRSFTFRKTGRIRSQGYRFLLNSLLGLSIATLLPLLLTGQHPNVVFGTVCVSVPVVSYIVQKLFVFKD